MLIVSMFGWLVTLGLVNPLNCMSVLCLISVCSVFWCGSPLLNSHYSSLCLSVDSLNSILVSLSVWIVLLMYMVSMKKEYLFNLAVGVLLQVVVLFFLVDHMMLFYILFEVSLLPTLFLILKWGYQPERLQAGTYFMMYTICASLPLLIGVLMIYGSTNSLSLSLSAPMTLNSVYEFSWGLHFCFFAAFLVKIPMWGVHLWLPKAHVEAPVSGSMILAGVLLKLGGYGLMKIYLLTLSFENYGYLLICAISLWGSVVVSFVCMRQVDVKSLIAYSSVIHMALMIVGILWAKSSGWLGSGMMMVAHGFSSSGLFVMANSNYLCVGSRNLLLYKGVMLVYPISALLWFLLLMANMAAPPSLNLAAELLIYTNVLKFSWCLGVLLGVCTFMAASYNLYLYSSQQGKPSLLSYPSQVWTSNMILVSFLHIIPVYALVLCMNFFY